VHLHTDDRRVAGAKVKRELGRVLARMDRRRRLDCIRVGLCLVSFSGWIQVLPKKRIESVSIRSQPVDLSFSPLAIFQHDRLIRPPPAIGTKIRKSQAGLATGPSLRDTISFHDKLQFLNPSQCWWIPAWSTLH
jgi:hypothetical protein